MNRRSLLLFSLLCIIPHPVRSEELQSREFWRYIRPLDKWIKITRYDIKPNDILRVFDPPDGFDKIVKVTRVEEDQFWTNMEIDPSTNQWVSYDK